MNKKILSIFLAVAMLVSSMATALAAKKNYEDEADGAIKNIYELWGDFSSEGALAMITKQSSAINTSIVKGGADGTKTALKIDTSAATGGSKDILIEFPTVAGETYEVSFYLKTDTPGVDSCGLIASFKDSGWYYLPSATMAVGSWTKYRLIYNCTGLNTHGERTDGRASLQFRFGGNAAAVSGVYYLDELSVIPEGIMSADYSIVNKGFIAEEMEEEEEIDTSVIAARTEAVNFSDVTGHWAETTIETLAAYDYVAGMGDGTFSPNTQVTRAQFIKMIADLYGIVAPEYDGRYADVKGDEWFASYLMLADKLDLIDDSFKADGNIYPDRAITREEAATVAARVAKDRGAVVNESNATSFTDNASISSWAREGVKNAAAYGLIKGYDTGDYKPQANITRAEAAQILFRVVEVKSRMLIYVDAQNGSNTGDGTAAAPLKTIEAARDLAAKYALNMQNDIKILLRGTFKLNKTITFTEEHSGANGYNIIYTSWGDEKPVITMADNITDFQLWDEDLNIYRAYVGKGTETRQVYFNDRKGIRSRSVGYAKNIEYTNQAYWLTDSKELLDFAHPEELEMVFHINWCNPRYTVASIEETSDGRVKVMPKDYFQKYKARVDFALGYPRSSPSYFENALELVDQKGEWYLSKSDGYLYYIPRADEDMSTMVAKVPTGEWMMNTKVSAYDTPWSNVTFENIIFEGTTWMRPTEMGGHHDAQNNHIREETDVAPGAAISFDKCTNINFYNNRFQMLGITALELTDGADHCEVIGNRFDQIAGTAVAIDEVNNHSNYARPALRPVESYVEYIKVNNNYITNTAQDYKSAAAVSFAWPRHSEFNHNEIAYTSYSGFHGSYGWQGYEDTGTVLTDVDTSYNYVHDIFTDRVYDGGGWYTVGASSYEGGNKKYQNRCFGNYFTNSWTCAYIYPDEGSSGWHFKDNVVDTTMVKKHENNLETDNELEPWFSHMHATSIHNLVFEDNWSNEGCDYAYKYGWMNAQQSDIEPLNFFAKDEPYPAEPQAIVDNAGLEPEYKARWADELSGGLFLACDDRRQAPELNKPFDGGFKVLGHDFKKLYNFGDYEYDVWCDDPEAITVDKNGMVTVHKKGIWEAELVMTIGNHTYLKHLKYEAGDEVEKLEFNVQNIALVEGGTVQYSLVANTTFGFAYDVTKDAKVDLKVADESVVKLSMAQKFGSELDQAVQVEYVGKGETEITGTIEYRGLKLDIKVPVKTITYSNQEAASLPFRTISLASGWKNTPSPVAGGGVNVTGSPNHFGGNVSNELIAFDMVCNPGNTWPSLVLCDNDQMGNYSSNDCYLIGFKSDIIELQRFNSGQRTMIFGDQGFSPIGGPGLPNLDGKKVIEYGKRYSIVVGAINEGNATRIVFNVNGKNVFDFYDTNDNRLDPRAKSFFAIYNPATNGGGFIFYPYSGITDAE